MAKKIKFLAGDLKAMSRKITERVKEILPQVVAVEGLNHFEESWDNQGFTDSGLTKWQGRKAPSVTTTKKGKATSRYKRWKEKDAGRAILISHQTDTQGTHLKDTLRVVKSKRKVIFSSDKAYAEVHNEGGRSGRGAGFMMPRRQFMGPSKVLDKKIEKKLTTEIRKTLIKALTQ